MHCGWKLNQINGLGWKYFMWKVSWGRQLLSKLSTSATVVWETLDLENIITVYISNSFFKDLLLNFCLTSNIFQDRTCALTPVETKIIRGISHARTLLRTTGLSEEDRYEKDVVLTHWFGGMLQPRHLTGPYLPWADCTSRYASVIFVGKKDTAVKARWVKKKKRVTEINSLSSGFCMIMIICLSGFILERMQDMTAIHWNIQILVLVLLGMLLSYLAKVVIQHEHFLHFFMSQVQTSEIRTKHCITMKESIQII